VSPDVPVVVAHEWPALLVQAAELIAGTNQPPDMILVRAECESLARVIAEERNWPTGAELRDQWNALADAARELDKRLTPALRTYLFHVNRPRRLPGLSTCAEVNAWLSALNAEAREQAQAIPQGKKGRKAARDVPVPFPEGLSAKAICARIVAGAWQAARGEDVPHTNPDAWRACMLLWQASGGALAGGTASGWACYLRRAKATSR
jgi:hypothetical protein